MGSISTRTFFGGQAPYSAPLTVDQTTNLAYRLWVFQFSTSSRQVFLPQIQYVPLGYRVFIIANNGGLSFTLKDGDGGSLLSAAMASNKAAILSTYLISGNKRWAFDLWDWSTN